jgi:hypothetical protein
MAGMSSKKRQRTTDDKSNDVEAVDEIGDMYYLAKGKSFPEHYLDAEWVVTAIHALQVRDGLEGCLCTCTGFDKHQLVQWFAKDYLNPKLLERLMKKYFKMQDLAPNHPSGLHIAAVHDERPYRSSTKGFLYLCSLGDFASKPVMYWFKREQISDDLFEEYEVRRDAEEKRIAALVRRSTEAAAASAVLQRRAKQARAARDNQRQQEELALEEEEATSGRFSKRARRNDK